MKSVRTVALLTAASTFALIVLGGIVRITGSGMGCDDDWPLCNGRLIPRFGDIATAIEYGHRVFAFALSILVVALAFVAYRKRREAGGGAVFRLSLVAVGLLVVQVILGQITVAMELPPTSVILHLGTAMALLACVQLIAMQARGGASGPVGGDRRLNRSAIVAAGLGALAVLLGAVTANTGAAGACLGFPLCNGQLWPSAGAGGLAHIHWMHRLVAYALTFHLIGMAAAGRRRRMAETTKTALFWALGLTAIQVAIAAAMVLSVLQPHWRGAHVAVGTAVWMSLVVLVWRTRSRPSAVPDPAEAVPVAAA